MSDQSEVLQLEIAAAPITAELVTENLLLRLYQPGGVPEPDDPWFSGGHGGGGGLTQEQLDLLEKAVIDAAVAEAKVQLDQTADDIATSVLAQARTLLDSILAATVSQQIATLQTDTQSIAIKVDTVGSRLDQNAAAIQQELLTYADKDSALALSVDQVVAGNARNTAAINETKTAYVDADSAISKRVDTLVTSVGDARALIVDVDQTRADDYQALSNRMTTIESTVSNDVDAKIQTISNTVATNYSATAQQITSVTTTLNGHTTSINTVQQSVNGVSAKWGVEIQGNGWISGITLNNNGGRTNFNVVADNFTVQLPGWNGIAPFQAGWVNGVPMVTIPGVFIQEASITTAKIADAQITYAKIGDAQIGAAKIIDGNITNAKIQDGAITNAKIGDAQITTAKIGTAQVDTLRIGANAVSTMVAFSGTGNWTYQSGGGQVVIMISAFCGNSNGVGSTASVNVGGASTFVQSVYESKCASFIQTTLGTGSFGVSVTSSGASSVFVVILEVKR